MPVAVPVDANMFVVRLRDGQRIIPFGVSTEDARTILQQSGHKEPELDRFEVASFATSGFTAAAYLASAAAYAPDSGGTRTLTARHYVLFRGSVAPVVMQSALAALEERHRGSAGELISQLSGMNELEARESLLTKCIRAVDVDEQNLEPDESEDLSAFSVVGGTVAAGPGRVSGRTESASTVVVSDEHFSAGRRVGWLAAFTVLAGAGGMAAVLVLVVLLMGRNVETDPVVSMDAPPEVTVPAAPAPVVEPTEPLEVVPPVEPHPAVAVEVPVRFVFDDPKPFVLPSGPLRVLVQVASGSCSEAYLLWRGHRFSMERTGPSSFAKSIPGSKWTSGRYEVAVGCEGSVSKPTKLAFEIGN